MPTEPKPESPTYYWLSIADELLELLDLDDVRYNEVKNSCLMLDMELLTVADFCLIEPGNVEDITIEDAGNGNYLNKYRQAAKQAAFYKLCRDA